MSGLIGGSLSTNEQGRTTFSGIGSGIDFQRTVDGIIEARRAPADRLENRIENNQAQIDALNDLQSRFNALQQAADALRGQASFDNAGDVFETKESFLSASRSDGQEASVATSLLTANVENDAQATTHNLEILQTAEQHRIAGDSVTNAGADLATETGLANGTFTLNGREVAVNGTDSLLDVRDKINAANTGDNASGVTATVVSVSETQAVLQLSSDEPGTRIAMEETSGTPLEQLGILQGEGTAGDQPDDLIKTELQAPQTSVFRADGLSDGSVFESRAVAGDANTTVDAFGVNDGDTLTFDIANDQNTTQVSVTVADASATSVGDLASQLDAEFGIQARAVEENGNVRLEVNAENTEDVQRSRQVSNPTNALSSLDGVAADATDITFSVQGGPGQDPQSVTLSGFDPSSSSLNDLATAIDGLGGLVRARVENDRLIVRAADGADQSLGKLSITSDTGTLVEDLDIEATNNVPQLQASGTATDGGDLDVTQADAISRPTNTVDNLFEGTTLNLFQAERGTQLDLDIERDQDAVNTAVQDFVTAFNDVKQFLNAQRMNVALEDQDEDVVGALQGEPILSDAEQRLNSIVSNGASNVGSDFQVLGQIGVNFVDNGNLTDPTLEDTLQIDQGELNDKLLNDFDDLRGLFQFNFSSNSSNVTLLNFEGTTGAGSETLDVTTDGSSTVTGATLASGNAVTIDGNRITVDEGPLNGLSFLFTGENSENNISLNTGTGIGSEAFFTSRRVGGDDPNALLQGEIDRLTGRNDNFEEEIEDIEATLDRERQRLTQQFITMEQALIELENTRQRLEQLAGTSSGNDN